MPNLNTIQTAISNPQILATEKARSIELQERIRTFSLDSSAGKALYVFTFFIFPVSWPIIFGINRYTLHQLTTELPCMDLMGELHNAITDLAPEQTKIVIKFPDNSRFEFNQMPDEKLRISADNGRELLIPDMNFAKLEDMISRRLYGHPTDEPEAPTLTDGMRNSGAPENWIDRDEEYDRE